MSVHAMKERRHRVPDEAIPRSGPPGRYSVKEIGLSRDRARREKEMAWPPSRNRFGTLEPRERGKIVIQVARGRLSKQIAAISASAREPREVPPQQGDAQNELRSLPDVGRDGRPAQAWYPRSHRHS